MEPSPAIDFLAFAEHSADLVCRIGLDYRTCYVSPASRSILGFAPEEISGRSAAEIIHPEDLPAALAAGQRRLQGDESQATEMRVRNRQGEWVWLEMRGSVLRDAEGTPLEFLVIFRDISERKKMEMQLQRLAMTDGLTELPNRRAFDEALEREWRRVLREGTQASLLLLDVDHFKGFNDEYGHVAGDDCLRAVAHAVRAVTKRPADMVARYGGEELAVILPGTDLQGALHMAGLVRCAVESLDIAHATNEEGQGRVTVSIGVATALSRDGGRMKMPESLLMAADSALYKAKLHGRNRVAHSLLVASREFAETV
ncbi:GGDEF domain-containing protein [Terriglobus roseus]|uniref:diguanylate cyclase n=1 Tax=Terriglobus roseus TaxID=392734 RepID=A0A1G7MYU1_9BACT|nr:sensor domain-containing diguanylate cyclase [Terriglobus roseus]SDF66847.1 PAS domain S-box-containing protein/diguanylate cyclase (GGDEF) domain-containing protein [Terriglobus roseus]